jgi:CheY-like chemotaxis protein
MTEKGQFSARLGICTRLSLIGENAMWNGKPIDEKLVLVVDDDRSIRESLAGLLDVKGYSVLEAGNGQKALDVLEKAAYFPCLILLDLAMPIIDGRGFLKLRAKDPMLRQIPVVVLSGNPPSAEPLNGIEAYLQKPVSFDRLIAAVDLAAGS